MVCWEAREGCEGRVVEVSGSLFWPGRTEWDSYRGEEVWGRGSVRGEGVGVWSSSSSNCAAVRAVWLVGALDSDWSYALVMGEEAVGVAGGAP